MLRVAPPLIALACLGSPEEADLAKKATRVIKVAFTQTATIERLDADLASSTLKSVHSSAKKVHTVDIQAVFVPCCRYLIRNMCHSGQDDLVREQYKASMQDYFTHKQSKLPLPILQDFINRHPTCAWGARDTLVSFCLPGGSAKVFAQLQAFDLLKDLILATTVAKVSPVCLSACG